MFEHWACGLVFKWILDMLSHIQTAFLGPRILVLHPWGLFRYHWITLNNPLEHSVPILGDLGSVDPDQTPQNAASDQGLHCLHTGISIKNKIRMQKYTRHALKVQSIWMAESIRHICVLQWKTTLATGQGKVRKESLTSQDQGKSRWQKTLVFFKIYCFPRLVFLKIQDLYGKYIHVHGVRTHIHVHGVRTHIHATQSAPTSMPHSPHPHPCRLLPCPC